MNKITTIAIASVIALSIAGIASADNASVFVSPTSGAKNIGQAFSATVELSASSNNACVISGDIAFSNLTCQSISLASGMMAQTAPTCQAPHFVVGIPQCTVNAKTLLQISAIGSNPGAAAINLSNVSILNQNGVVPSSSANANYTMQGVLASTTTNTNTTATGTTNTSTTTTTTGGQTSTETTQPATAGTETTNPLTPAAVSTATGSNSFLASLKDSIFRNSAIWILIILVLLVAAYYIVKTFYKKEQPKK